MSNENNTLSLDIKDSKKQQRAGDVLTAVVGASGRGAVPGAHRAAGGGGAPRQPGHQAPALRPHTRADQLLRVRICSADTVNIIDNIIIWYMQGSCRAGATVLRVH